MNWIVSLLMSDGRIAVVSVIARHRSDAEYRAAYKAETIHKTTVLRVVRCVRG